MKTRNIYLSLVLIFIITYSYGQARLGSTIDDIKKEFTDPSLKLTPWFDKGMAYIDITIPRALVVYSFNTEGICAMTVIIPNTVGNLNYYVERYNNSYVILSTTKWRMYNDTGSFLIELKYPEEGGYWLIWTFE